MTDYNTAALAAHMNRMDLEDAYAEYVLTEDNERAAVRTIAEDFVQALDIIRYSPESFEKAVQSVLPEIRALCNKLCGDHMLEFIQSYAPGVDSFDEWNSRPDEW